MWVDQSKLKKMADRAVFTVH